MVLIPNVRWGSDRSPIGQTAERSTYTKDMDPSFMSVRCHGPRLVVLGRERNYTPARCTSSAVHPTNYVSPRNVPGNGGRLASGDEGGGRAPPRHPRPRNSAKDISRP